MRIYCSDNQCFTREMRSGSKRRKTATGTFSKSYIDASSHESMWRIARYRVKSNYLRQVENCKSGTNISSIHLLRLLAVLNRTDFVDQAKWDGTISNMLFLCTSTTQNGKRRAKSSSKFTKSQSRSSILFFKVL